MANWDKIASRGNVEDRRGSRMLALGGGGLSITGLALLLLFNYLGGGNLGDVVSQLPSVIVPQEQAVDTSAYEGADDYEVFASTVLGSTNDMWSRVFASNNMTYEPPKLVLFRDYTNSGCGGASAAAGPHYCPIDRTIYLDETFFNELQSRFGAGAADVAQAYVIAHEAGHHAQNELGIVTQVVDKANASPDTANELSVKQELQADCFAGLWAYSIKDLGVLGFGEIQEAIDAAAAVGDDRIQETTTGRIDPESWTHGSSTERTAWFAKGYENGDVAACDTFNS